ncbi:MAG: alpha-2-macroglobulin, partial [Spirochaetia bacterium]
MRSRGVSFTTAVIGVVLAAIVVLTGCRRGEEESSVIRAAAKETAEIQRRLFREVDISTDLDTYEIEYFSPRDIPEIAAPIRESDEPFQIVDYGPVDELPAEMEYPSVYVVFSQPVVPLSRLGRPMETSDIMEIDPPIEGVFRWYGTRLLSFDASERVVSQQIYRVSVDEAVTSLGGKELLGDTVFSFRSEYLTVRDFVVGPLSDPASDPSDVPPDKAAEAVIIFSYPVNLDFIKGYISVEAGGRGLPFNAVRPENDDGRYPPEQLGRMVRILLDEEPPADTDVTVTVRKGARSEPDYVGIPEPIVLSYHTLRPFALRDYDTYSWTFPRSPKGDSKPVYFTFSHPVAEESLEGRIHTMPEVEVGPENIEVRENTVKLNGLAVEHEKKYRFFFDPEIEDTYGRSLGSRTEVAVTIPPAERYAYFPNTGSRMLEADFPARVVWEYQNVFDGVWRADPIDDPYESFPSRSLEPFDFSGKERNVR